MKILKIIFILCFLFVFEGLFNYDVFATTKYSSSGYKNNSVYPSSIKIKKDFGSVRNLGKEYQLNIEYYPTNTTEKDITWTSSDNSILTIDKNGVLIAKKRGTVKVTAKTVNGKTDSTTITVYGSNSTSGELKSIKSISILNSPKQMLTGEEFTLNIQVSPQYDVLKKYTFKSSNKKVLTVDNNGVVKAVGSGKATITVTTNNKKTAKTTIEVKDYKIKLSETYISGYEGNSKEITATVETKKKIENVEWSVTQPNSAYVKSTSSSGNTFKANIYMVKSGNTKIKVKIGNESAGAKVKINKLGMDTTIECPSITYDISDNYNIKLNISPGSNIKSYDIDLSYNKQTGSNAKWGDYVNNVQGIQSYSIPYSYAQARITVFDKNGKSRYCYTAPFDLDTNKNSGTKVTYNYANACPTITETNLNKVSGSNVYSIHLYGSKDIVKTGVKSTNIKINMNTNSKYQYGWLVKDGRYYVSNICDENGCGTWNLSQTFDQHKNKNFVLTTSDANYYDIQGMVLVINTKGDVRPCYTGIYNSLAFNKKVTINNTNVYFEKNYEHDTNSMINIINSIPPQYLAASNIFFLSNNTYIKFHYNESCGVASFDNLTTYLRGGNICYNDYAKTAIIHELGHIIDGMYYKMKNSTYISFQNDIVSAKNKYIGKGYLRDYSFTNNYEFWADLFSIYYINNDKSFNNNSYKYKWSLDNNLTNLIKKYNNEIYNLYSNNKSATWNNYKKQFQ